jgi:hypothetical protein
MSDIPSSDTISEPTAAIRQISDVTSSSQSIHLKPCSCATGCDTFRCRCKKEGKQCSSCNCKGCKNKGN